MSSRRDKASPLMVRTWNGKFPPLTKKGPKEDTSLESIPTHLVK